jgi:hypothetical protein
VRVAVVLDASALRAYARLDGVAVGELIATVAEDGDVTGVPVLVMVDVWTGLDEGERDMVGELVGRADGPVAVLPLHTEAVEPVAAHVATLGYGGAQAAAAVTDLGATLATYDPGAYEGALDPYDVLELS